MLRNAKTLYGFTLGAVDGEIGKVKDGYFDDEAWAIRYLVADTGNWLEQRLVLISPLSLVSLDEERHIIATTLTRSQIENSPTADTDEPVSRQFEVEYHAYYGWPIYWLGTSHPWGPYPYPAPPTQETEHAEEPSGDSHLRSLQEVDGYAVGASDAEVGHVVDFLIDDEDWSIRYLVVDTRNWWPGKHVLLSPQWVAGVSLGDRTVSSDLDRETIKSAPEYTRDSAPTPEYERDLFFHYGREDHRTKDRDTSDRKT